MGTHLIMKQKGDKKANKEQQGCRQAAALRSTPEVIRALHCVLLVTAESPGVTKDRTLASLLQREPYLFSKETVCPH